MDILFQGYKMLPATPIPLAAISICNILYIHHPQASLNIVSLESYCHIPFCVTLSLIQSGNFLAALGSWKRVRLGCCKVSLVVFRTSFFLCSRQPHVSLILGGRQQPFPTETLLKGCWKGLSYFCFYPQPLVIIEHGFCLRTVSSVKHYWKAPGFRGYC